jgi:hypothetical protein
MNIDPETLRTIDDEGIFEAISELFFSVGVDIN